jgi:hypothetical protein
MSYSVTRLTLYAILTAVEEDLRETIRVHLTGQKEARDVLGEDVCKRATERLAREMGTTDTQPSLHEALLFIDFGDALSTLNAKSEALDQTTARHIREVTPSLERLVPVRHRVAHVRPLHFDDLANTTDVAVALIEKAPAIWRNVEGTLARLERDPGFVLGLDISASEADLDAGRHNLPTPDFDETGFVGRKQ